MIIITRILIIILIIRIIGRHGGGRAQITPETFVTFLKSDFPGFFSMFIWFSTFWAENGSPRAPK